MSVSARAARPGRINLNTADPAELLRLPGVSETLARDIIALRPVNRIKELLLIPELTPEHFEQLSPYLTLAEPRSATLPRRSPGEHRARRRPVVPEAVSSRARLPDSPTIETGTFTETVPATPIAAPPGEPPVVIVETRAASASFYPSIAPRPSPLPMVINPPIPARRLLFDSYAGPRLVFAALAITLILLATGVFTGYISFGRQASVAAIPPSATADILPTQVGLAVAATLTAQPTATIIPPTATATASATPTALPPTLTATPVATATVAVASTGMENTGDQIFNETFIPAGYWDLGENSFSKISITEGGYLDILMKMPGSIAWANNGFSGQDFYYQGTVRVGACQLGDYSGLTFRFKDENNFMLFGLSCDGRYRLLERVNGEFQPRVDFTFTSNAIAGSYTTNLLAVRAQGTQISLYINDQFITQIGVSEAYGGRFGVFAKSAQTSELLAEFDELAAWTLLP